MCRIAGICFRRAWADSILPCPCLLQKQNPQDVTKIISAQLEPTLKNHFCRNDDEKNRADERVKPEESEIDPVQIATTCNPMFQHETTYYEKPANEICDAKLT